MIKRGLLVFLLGAVSCESAPTAPQITLSLSQTSVQLTRNATLTVTAALTSPTGGSLDASKAEWTSSNTAVVTVDRGLLRASGLGTALVTASYRGRSARLNVSVRRNTAIGGMVAMRETTGRRPFGSLQLLLNNQELGGRGGSDHSGSERQEARYGWIAASSLRPRSLVEPGAATLVLRAVVDWGFSGSHHVVTEPLSYVEVFDTDTGESLERFSFPQTEATIVPAVNRFALVPVTITVRAYTQ